MSSTVTIEPTKPYVMKPRTPRTNYDYQGNVSITQSDCSPSHTPATQQGPPPQPHLASPNAQVSADI